MKYDGVFDKFSGEGFIKTSRGGSKNLSAQQRVVLNRKGNELLNKGDLETAKRIFITTGYSDGLIRIGNHYMSKNEPVEALQMYWLAPDRRRSGALIERMAGIIQKWLREEELLLPLPAQYLERCKKYRFRSIYNHPHNHNCNNRSD